MIRPKKNNLKNPANLSLSRDKSPKTKLYKELSQLVNIYTPLGVQSSKKRVNLMNNSFFNKRTITENEDNNNSINNNLNISTSNNNNNSNIINNNINNISISNKNDSKIDKISVNKNESII